MLSDPEFFKNGAHASTVACLAAAPRIRNISIRPDEDRICGSHLISIFLRNPFEENKLGAYLGTVNDPRARFTFRVCVHEREHTHAI